MAPLPAASGVVAPGAAAASRAPPAAGRPAAPRCARAARGTGRPHSPRLLAEGGRAAPPPPVAAAPPRRWRPACGTTGAGTANAGNRREGGAAAVAAAAAAAARDGAGAAGGSIAQKGVTQELREGGALGRGREAFGGEVMGTVARQRQRCERGRQRWARGPDRREGGWCGGECASGAQRKARSRPRSPSVVGEEDPHGCGGRHHGRAVAIATWRIPPTGAHRTRSRVRGGGSHVATTSSAHWESKVHIVGSSRG